MNNREAFFRLQGQTTPDPMGIEVSHAEGSYIYSTDGKAYLDLISGIAVSNVGHRHPKVVAAIKEQVDKYLHVIPYGEFIQAPQSQLALRLSEILPKGLDSSYFVNSGTEAIEASLKLAKRYTGRTKLVACEGAYHGSTHGSLSVSSNENKKFHVRPLLPEVYFMRYNRIEDLSVIDEHTAGVVVETVQGDAGVRIPDSAYIKALRKRCDETGALLILDEIQTGFGRTGTMFAFEQYGIVPDILAIAKSMAGGMAMGAFVSRSEIMSTLSHDPILGHITTFGGHPVCCAAAVANIDVLLSEGLVEGCEAKGAKLEGLLAHPAVREVRRKGMMLAVQFDSADLVYKIVDRCLERGVITFYFLSCPDSFRLAPPLNISDEDLEKGAAVIREVIDEVVQER
ncbi:MAG: aspartate aminotransferase family protein [Flavobacteriales bacterium]|nr:aspartate aminotransferase family protein [Flavobacteriales bacterium]